jgi:hypothetical protein
VAVRIALGGGLPAVDCSKVNDVAAAPPARAIVFFIHSRLSSRVFMGTSGVNSGTKRRDNQFRETYSDL